MLHEFKSCWVKFIDGHFRNSWMFFISVGCILFGIYLILIRWFKKVQRTCGRNNMPWMLLGTSCLTVFTSSLLHGWYVYLPPLLSIHVGNTSMLWDCSLRTKVAYAYGQSNIVFWPVLLIQFLAPLQIPSLQNVQCHRLGSPSLLTYINYCDIGWQNINHQSFLLFLVSIFPPNGI